MAQARNERYKQAGVDIDAGNALVERIKPHAKATLRAGVLGGLGGFGALFDLKAAGFTDPILVSTTDGVGTKLKLAQVTGDHRTIGIDLVAMCVNDLLVQGATPLFFLDYFATGKLNVQAASTVIEGIAKGCSLAGCALVGGETAEMPGMYAGEDYDLAGFAVGAVERSQLLPKASVGTGDVLIGLASSGVHSNGYSLVRALVEQSGVALEAEAPFRTTAASLGEALLTPTTIYVKALLPQLQAGPIKALAHLTGGGLTENLPRVLPEGVQASIDLGSWQLPPVFTWMRRVGDISDSEMLRTFNCGIGMILVVESSQAESILTALQKAGQPAMRIGELTRQGTARVAYQGSLCAA